VRPRPKFDCPRGRDPPQPPDRRPPPPRAATRSTWATNPRALRPCPAALSLTFPGRMRKSPSSLMAGLLSAENGLWCHSVL
ncbi:MAG TPA: hypothetical protein VNQ31_06050, partial [Sphingomonadaceae bacterium]|nr:hypothetical protein [Sphingomonadaceae bacterium]